MKPRAILLIALLVALGLMGGVVFYKVVPTEEGGWILAPISITLKTELPDSPPTAPLYRVVGDESFSYSAPDLMRIRENLPSEEDAPAIAIREAEEFGGIPHDAVLSHVETVYLVKLDTETGEREKYPLWVAVKFEREVDGMPVAGPGGEIDVSLGENGEIIYFSKVWRKLEYVSETEIISADEALEKLKRGEIIRKPMSPLSEVEVVGVKLGYYAGPPGEEQEFYRPTWIFYCMMRNDKLRLCVDAMA